MVVTKGILSVKKPFPQLGRAELAILRYVVEHHPISVREVADHMAKTTGQARTTVLTFMERLRKKGLLTRRKSQGANRYSPRVSKTELMNSLVADFVDVVLDGSVSPFFAYLSDNSKLDEKELFELEQLIKKLPTNKPKNK